MGHSSQIALAIANEKINKNVLCDLPHTIFSCKNQWFSIICTYVFVFEFIDVKYNKSTKR